MQNDFALTLKGLKSMKIEIKSFFFFMREQGIKLENKNIERYI